MKEFKFLGTILSKHGEMKREITAKIVKGRNVIGTYRDHEGEECAHGGKKKKG